MWAVKIEQMALRFASWSAILPVCLTRGAALTCANLQLALLALTHTHTLSHTHRQTHLLALSLNTDRPHTHSPHTHRPHTHTHTDPTHTRSTHTRPPHTG